MKHTLSVLYTLIFLTLFSPLTASAAQWKPTTPPGYTPLTWIKNRGIATFMKAPNGNGYIDFMTSVYLPYTQVGFITSSTPKQDWGPGKPPLEATDTIHDWAFPKMVVENAKAIHPHTKFFWNVPFFNVEIPITNLSLGLKSTDATSTYITSGSRPEIDSAQPRRMLIINNKTGTSSISTFDEHVFINDGDEAVEGFDPTILFKGADPGVARLFLGVKPGGKELLIYCSRGATPNEASTALSEAGVPIENQLQADGGTSVTCASDLPGHYFVEPGRTLPHLMGATPLLGRGTVTQKLLNVRSGPGTKYPIIKKIPAKTAVLIFENKNGWLRIANTNEWTLASYVKQILN